MFEFQYKSYCFLNYMSPQLLHVVANWGLEDLVYDLRAWFCTCKEPDAPFLSLLEVFTNEGLGHQNERFANNSLVNDPTPKSSYRINDALIYRYLKLNCRNCQASAIVLHPL